MGEGGDGRGEHHELCLWEEGVSEWQRGRKNGRTLSEILILVLERSSPLLLGPFEVGQHLLDTQGVSSTLCAFASTIRTL